MIDNATQLPPIKIHVRRIWSGVVIEAGGDLDLTSVPTFDEHYKAAQAHLQRMSESQILILDLRNVTFIDSVGLALLVRISQEMVGSQHRFQVVLRENSQPERIINLSCFDAVLNTTLTCSL